MQTMWRSSFSSCILRTTRQPVSNYLHTYVAVLTTAKLRTRDLSG